MVDAPRFQRHVCDCLSNLRYLMMRKSIHRCADCSSRRTTEWQFLSNRELKFVDDAKHTRVLEPGSILFHQGDDADGVYCIQSGLIGIRRITPAGDSALLRLCTNGVTIGYRALLSKTSHRNSAEALTNCVVCFVEGANLRRLLEISPRLGEGFLRHCFDELDKTESDYAKNLTLSLRARFLHTLLIFYERLGYRDKTDTCILELPIQRTELASLVGARPESISRLVRNLDAEGLVKFDKRMVRFGDLDAVLREVGVEL